MLHLKSVIEFLTSTSFTTVPKPFPVIVMTSPVPPDNGLTPVIMGVPARLVLNVAVSVAWGAAPVYGRNNIVWWRNKRKLVLLQNSEAGKSVPYVITVTVPRKYTRVNFEENSFPGSYKQPPDKSTLAPYCAYYNWPLYSSDFFLRKLDLLLCVSTNKEFVETIMWVSFKLIVD